MSEMLEKYGSIIVIIGFIGSILTILTVIIAVYARLKKVRIFSRKYVMWSSDGGRVEARYGDLLKIAFSPRLKKKDPKIVVVPVDTKFTMKLDKLGEKEFGIHPSSVHGQWIKKMRAIYGDTTFEELLDYRLKNNLNDDDLQKDEEGKSLDRYKIGAILPWLDEKDNTTFLLVATGDFADETRKTLTSSTDVDKCLESIFSFYCQRKTGNVYLPLIGAGITRAKTLQEAYDVLENFLGKEEIRREIHSRFTIVVYYKKKKEVSLVKK